MRRFLASLAVGMLMTFQTSGANASAMLFEGALNLPVKKGDYVANECEQLVQDKISLAAESVLECVGSSKNIMESLEYYLDELGGMGFDGSGFGPKSIGHFRGCRNLEAIEVFTVSLMESSSLSSADAPSAQRSTSRFREYMNAMRLAFVYNPGGC